MAIMRFSNPFPTLFDRMFDSDLMDWASRNFSETNTTLPSVNIKESNDSFEVEMAAPGFSKQDFKIELNNDQLTISSEKKMENEEKEGEQYTRREFSYQSFSRTFTLPNIVNGDKIHARYDNGVLRISIPKKEEAKLKPSKLIAIS